MLYFELESESSYITLKYEIIWNEIWKYEIKLNMKVAEEAYEQNTASTYPEPEDKEAFIRTHLYDYNYDKVFFLFQILNNSNYQSKINLTLISPYLAWLGKVFTNSLIRQNLATLSPEVSCVCKTPTQTAHTCMSISKHFKTSSCASLKNL